MGAIAGRAGSRLQCRLPRQLVGLTGPRMEQGRKHGPDDLHAARLTNAYLASAERTGAESMENALHDADSRQGGTAVAAKPASGARWSVSQMPTDQAGTGKNAGQGRRSRNADKS